MLFFADHLKRATRLFCPAIIAASAITGLAANEAYGADILAGGIAPSAASAGICAHQHSLSRVTYNFYHNVRHVPEMPLIRIKAYSDVTAIRDEPAVGPYNINRYYCSAVAHMDDGSNYPVWYLVETGQGFAGIGGINVDYCFEPFDRWRVHDNSCRTVR